MKLYSVEGNRQRLDGGAMFGNCPRALWQRWCPPDEENRISLACRGLLVHERAGETAERRVLLEAGIGAFFEPKLRARFGVETSEHVLLQSLAAIGVAPEQIDVVVLSHLHFDHAGGLLTPWAPDAEPTLVFPNAQYVVGCQAWERACAPHPRDRASFIPALQPLLAATERLELVDGETCATLGPDYRFEYSEGHTPGLTLTTVSSPMGPITFAADLIPGTPWVHLPITMGYDRFAERVIDEKRTLLERVVDQNGWLFFTHDAQVAAARVTRDERGRFGAVETRARLP
ncbi:MAG: MBL fold metallo-hydrolase [bacterium]|nr:MBL fold metallo-hydrolase [bacterium]